MTRKPPFAAFMLDANYFRLAYQLAAQRANGSIEREEARFEALRDADDVAQRADRVLDWFASREAAGRWRRSLRLTAQEQRLQLFLAATVEPCALLVASGVLAQAGNIEESDQRASALLGNPPRVAVTWSGIRRRPHPQPIRWSPRAFYNYACFESVRGERADLQFGVPPSLLVRAGLARKRERLLSPDEPIALWTLREAFRQAQGPQRRELVRWALEDPSLRLLRAMFVDEFRQLIRRYAPEGREAGGPAPAR